MNVRPSGWPAVLHAVVLVVIWVALWGSVSAANLVSGVLVAAVVVWVFPSSTTPGTIAPHPLRALAFIAYFLAQMVLASLRMAILVLTPKRRGSSGIVAVPLRGASPGITTVVANFVTLTPGTLTVEVRNEPTTLYVHVMQLDDAEQVRSEIQDIERRAIAAFGPTSARRELHRRGPA